MAKIILASHGELSKGMLNSVSMIVGELANEIETYSLYPGENPNDYALALKKKIAKDPSQYIIVCDVKGGSVYNALLTVCINKNVSIISGMNMNLILELVISNNSGSVNIAQAMESAKAGITIENYQMLNRNIEEEDFQEEMK